MKGPVPQGHSWRASKPGEMLESFRGHVRALWAEMDMRTVVVLLTVPVLLTWLEFRSNDTTFSAWFAPYYWGARSPIEYQEHTWDWWSINCVVCMFVIPALIVRFVFKQPLRDFGLTMPKPGTQIPLAFFLYALVLPVIITASRAPAFQQTYPLFSAAGTSATLLLHWEILYLAQFFALEFFFRGFLVFGLEKRFGANAVLIATVPYCMVHFHKPMPEALAAIVAGVVLGSVALRTRSLWSGFLVHALVALTMDFLALHAKGFF